MKVELQKAEAEDAEALDGIQKKAFRRLYERYRDEGSPYLRGVEELLSWLGRPNWSVYKIYAVEGEARTLAGGAAFREDAARPGEYYLARIYVLPELQNRGIASSAIALCEAEVKNAVRWTLDFPADQPANRRCYEKAGYVDTGETRDQSGCKITLALYEKLAGSGG